MIKMITCKNVFLLLLHKCFKRCIWAISVVLLLSDFKISWKAGKSQSEFQKNEWNAQFLSRKQFCKIFVLIRCLIRTDKMKCLRSISDIKTQIYGAKVVCMLLGYLFCFKVTDEIKHSINLPLITLHVGQWNLARGRHDHFVWPTFDREQRFFDLKINFLFEFVSKVLQGCLSFLGLDTFFMVIHHWYWTKVIDFETKFLFGVYQVL